MKKVLFYFLILILLLLDWLALDDITTGNEPGLIGEWTTLVVSIPLLIILLKKLRRKK